LGFVLLGDGQPKYRALFEQLARDYPEKVGVRFGFVDELAHQIEAGADMFLMPSKYEPCGLNQIYSLKYGTAPIVRATGGLDDTVASFNPVTEEGNGFKFEPYRADALLATVKKALEFYRRPAIWKKMMKNGMAADFSWDASARDYLDLYRHTLNL